jgi:hypothetical protein
MLSFRFCLLMSVDREGESVVPALGGPWTSSLVEDDIVLIVVNGVSPVQDGRDECLVFAPIEMNYKIDL